MVESIIKRKFTKRRVCFPLDVLTGHAIAYGKTRTGKSFFSLILIREAIANNVRVKVFDPHGTLAKRLKPSTLLEIHFTKGRADITDQLQEIYDDSSNWPETKPFLVKSEDFPIPRDMTDEELKQRMSDFIAELESSRKIVPLPQRQKAEQPKVIPPQLSSDAWDLVVNVCEHPFMGIRSRCYSLKMSGRRIETAIEELAERKLTVAMDIPLGRFRPVKFLILADKLGKRASYDMLEQTLDLFDDASCAYEVDLTLATAVMCRVALDSMLHCVWAASYKVAKITPNQEAPSRVSIEWGRVYAVEREEIVIGRRDSEALFIGQPVLTIPIKDDKISFPRISEMRVFLVETGLLTQPLSNDIEMARKFGNRAAHLEEIWMEMIAQKIEPSLHLRDERKDKNPYVTKDEAKQALEVVEHALLYMAERWDDLAAPVQVPARTRASYC